MCCVTQTTYLMCCVTKTTIEVRHKEKGISKSSNNHFHNAYAYHVTFPCMLHLRKDDTER